MRTYFSNSVAGWTKRGLVIGVSMILLPIAAQASTSVALTASNQSLKAGQEVSVSVKLDPSSQSVYTAKLALAYPAALLEFKSFSYAPTWIPITMSDSDAVDTVNGKITKTAGYPDGTTNGAIFGTVVFIAKKSGSAAVSVTNETQILDANSANVYSNTNPSIDITIASASVPAAPATSTMVAKPKTVAKTTPTAPPRTVAVVKPKTATSSPLGSNIASNTNLRLPSATSTFAARVRTPSQTAAAINAFSIKKNAHKGYVPSAIFLVLLAMSGAGYLYLKKRRSHKKAAKLSGVIAHTDAGLDEKDTIL